MPKLTQYQGHWLPQGCERAWQRYASRARDMQPAVEMCGHLRTVVQAGGNVGAWPIWLAANFIEVITFEPEKQNYTCLARNIAPHHNILAYHAALGAEPGKLSLNVCKSIGSHHLIMEPGDIDVKTIDSLNLEYLDLIVLDVEGAEALALRGARETIARCQPIIHLEDRGHGLKKGFGLTFDDVVAALPNYTIERRVGRDVIFKPRVAT